MTASYHFTNVPFSPNNPAYVNLQSNNNLSSISTATTSLSSRTADYIPKSSQFQGPPQYPQISPSGCQVLPGCSSTPQQPQFYRPTPQPSPHLSPDAGVNWISQQGSDNHRNLYQKTPDAVSSPLSTELNQEQRAYVAWLRQIQEQPEPQQGSIQRPWVIWWVAILDILMGITCTAIFVKLFFAHIFPVFGNPDSAMWMLFFAFLGLAIRLLMGLLLVAGLLNKDDSNTLWYCKLWVTCQFLVISDDVFSIVDSFFSKFNYYVAIDVGTLGFALTLVIICYRVSTFVLVRRYMKKLRESERRLNSFRARFSEQEIRDREQGLNEEMGENTAPDSSLCGPYVAFLMSL